MLPARTKGGQSLRSPEFIEKVFGGPGTGKTTYLMGRLQEEIRNGVEPEEIAFVTFTRDAREVATRAAQRALIDMQYGAADLPYFRTFHSLASRLLGTNDASFVGRAHLEYYSKAVGLDYNPDLAAARDGLLGDDLLDPRQPLGNLVFNLDSWLVNTRTAIEESWRAPLEHDITPTRLIQEVHRYRRWKKACGLLDFADLLDRVLQAGVTPPTRVLFVDEFQDLSPLQYAVYEQWAADQERVYIAGDDDQTIFGFQGASQNYLLKAPCTLKTVLDRTYRLPRRIWDYDSSLIRRVAVREPKDITPARDGGQLVSLERPGIDELLAHLDPYDSFILARTRRQVNRIKGQLLRAGVPFRALGREGTWTSDLVALKHVYQALYATTPEPVSHAAASVFLRSLTPYDLLTRSGYVHEAKAAAFLDLRRRFANTWPLDPLGQHLDAWTLDNLRPYLVRIPERGEFFSSVRVSSSQREALLAHLQLRPEWPTPAQGGVQVGTIHSSKGRQARVVVLMSDISRRAVARLHESRDQEDAETRVFYVGATRAIDRLVVAQPYFSNSYYRMPEVHA